MKKAFEETCMISIVFSGHLLHICICISLHKSFRQSEESQSTQRMKASVGINQVSELNEIRIHRKKHFFSHSQK